MQVKWNSGKGKSSGKITSLYEKKFNYGPAYFFILIAHSLILLFIKILL